MTSGVFYPPLRMVKTAPANIHEWHIADTYFARIPIAKGKTKVPIAFSFDEYVRFCRNASSVDAIEISAVSDYLRLLAQGFISADEELFLGPSRSNSRKKKTADDAQPTENEDEGGEELDPSIVPFENPTANVEELQESPPEVTTNKLEKHRDSVATMLNKSMLSYLTDVYCRVIAAEKEKDMNVKTELLRKLENDFNTVLLIHLMLFQSPMGHMLTSMSYKNNNTGAEFHVPRQSKMGRSITRFNDIYETLLFDDPTQVPYFDLNTDTIRDFRESILLPSMKQLKEEGTSDDETQKGVNRRIALFGAVNLLTPEIKSGGLIRSFYESLKNFFFWRKDTSRQAGKVYNVNHHNLGSYLMETAYIPDIILKCRDEVVIISEEARLFDDYTKDLSILREYIEEKKEKAPDAEETKKAHAFFDKLFSGQYVSTPIKERYEKRPQDRKTARALVTDLFPEAIKKPDVRMCEIIIPLSQLGDVERGDDDGDETAAPTQNPPDSSKSAIPQLQPTDIRALCVFMRSIDLVSSLPPTVLSVEYPHHHLVAEEYEEKNRKHLLGTLNSDTIVNERIDVAREFMIYMDKLIQDYPIDKKELLSELNMQTESIFGPKSTAFYTRAGRVAYQTDAFYFHTITKLYNYHMAKAVVNDSEQTYTMADIKDYNPAATETADWVGFLIFDIDKNNFETDPTSVHRAFSVIKNQQTTLPDWKLPTRSKARKAAETRSKARKTAENDDDEEEDDDDDDDGGFDVTRKNYITAKREEVAYENSVAKLAYQTNVIREYAMLKGAQTIFGGGDKNTPKPQRLWLTSAPDRFVSDLNGIIDSIKKIDAENQSARLQSEKSWFRWLVTGRANVEWKQITIETSKIRAYGGKTINLEKLRKHVEIVETVTARDEIYYMEGIFFHNKPMTLKEIDAELNLLTIPKKASKPAAEK